MPITLTITDNKDGSGGVATIAGSPVGSTNQLFSSVFDGKHVQQTPTLVGSRVGDGIIVLIAQGYFHYLLLNQTSGEYALNLAALTDEADAEGMHYRILKDVEVVVNSLNLVPNTFVVKKWLPHVDENQSVKTPAIIISPYPSPEAFPGLLTGKDDISYPTLVSIVTEKQPLDYTANLNRNLMWREKIMSAFRFQALPGVHEVFNCIPQPLAIIEPAVFHLTDYMYHGCVFQFIARQLRGIF